MTCLTLRTVSYKGVCWIVGFNACNFSHNLWNHRFIVSDLYKQTTYPWEDYVCVLHNPVGFVLPYTLTVSDHMKLLSRNVPIFSAHHNLEVCRFHLLLLFLTVTNSIFTQLLSEIVCVLSGMFTIQIQSSHSCCLRLFVCCQCALLFNTLLQYNKKFNCPFWPQLCASGFCLLWQVMSLNRLCRAPHRLKSLQNAND